MRVAVCSSGIFPLTVGGIQRHSRLLIETLAHAYPQLKIEVLHTHVGHALFKGIPNVCEHAVTARPGAGNFLNETHALSGRVADVLRTMPDAVVYAQGMDVWKGIEEFTPRLIVNPHGLESYQALTLKQKLIGVPYKMIHNHIFRHARFVVSLGGRLTSILHRHVPHASERVVVIPNGVLPAEGARAAETPAGSPCKALFVSRLVYNKGVPDLIRSFHLLGQRGFASRISLTVAGDGPLRDRFPDDTLPPHIRFVGSVDDAALDSLYRSSHVFVLPTLFEGMPTVVLEAMARGLPIIVTDVGATKELVDDSNGMIIPSRDPRALADALQHFLELPLEARLAMGKASIEKVARRFTWQRVAEAHYDLFFRVSREMAL
jgi:glycosyltransferase involved in cell wall biosynthesis